MGLVRLRAGAWSFRPWPGHASPPLTVTSHDGSQAKTDIETAHIVVVTGSRPIEIPGFAFDHKHVWSSTEALAPSEVPKRLP